MLKREDHETKADLMDEKNLSLLHQNTRYKKRGKDNPNNNVFHEDRKNFRSTKEN